MAREPFCAFCSSWRVFERGGVLVEKRWKKAGGVPLSTLQRGQKGRIEGLSPRREADLHKFLTLGLIPGEKFTVMHHRPLHVVQVGHTQIALDRESAAVISVFRE